MVPESSLDTALAQLERIHGSQLNSIDGLSTKVSVLFGFVLTSFGALFGLSRSNLASHLPGVLLSAGLLALSAFLLAFAYRVRNYYDAPDPRWLFRNLGDSTVEVKRKLVENLAGVYLLNRHLIAKQFESFNGAITLFISGIIVFVLGVWVA